MVRRVLEEGWSFREAAEAVGVSRRTAWKWVDRFRRGEGLAGILVDGEIEPTDTLRGLADALERPNAVVRVWWD
jgi:hypothetical protein